MKLSRLALRTNGNFLIRIALLLTLVASPAGWRASTRAAQETGARDKAAGVEGTWQGTLDAGEKLRLVLTISKSASGYTGNIDSLDQGASIPADVTVNGDSVRVELKSVGAVYE